MKAKKSNIKTGEEIQTGTKLSGLNERMAALQKKFGGVVRMGNEIPQFSADRCISSGNIAIDWSFGGFGIPFGRVVEFFGPESSGKTSLALQFLAQAQKMGVTCAFVDAEQSVSPDYLSMFDVDMEKLIVMNPEFGEQAFDFIKTVIPFARLIVVDSVTALVPKVEDENDFDKTDMALQARMMSKGLRKIIGPLHDADATIIFINQEREKVGVVFGSPTVTTGGNALKFYAAVRARIVRTDFLGLKKKEAVKSNKKGKEKEEEEKQPEADDTNDAWGQVGEIRNVKCKCGVPRRTAAFELHYGKNGRRSGIIPESGCLERGLATGVFQKSGTWINYGEEQMAQGRNQVIQYLYDNPHVMKKAMAEISAAQEREDRSQGVTTVVDVPLEDGEPDDMEDAEE